MAGDIDTGPIPRSASDNRIEALWRSVAPGLDDIAEELAACGRVEAAARVASIRTSLRAIAYAGRGESR